MAVLCLVTCATRRSEFSSRSSCSRRACAVEESPYCCEVLSVGSDDTYVVVVVDVELEVEVVIDAAASRLRSCSVGDRTVIGIALALAVDVDAVMLLMFMFAGRSATQ